MNCDNFKLIALTLKRLKRSKWTLSGVVIGYWACVCLLRNASYYVIFLFYLELDFGVKLIEKSRFIF